VNFNGSGFKLLFSPFILHPVMIFDITISANHGGNEAGTSRVTMR
jgi:hypothetical protein